MRKGRVDHHPPKSWLIRAFGISLVGLLLWVVVALTLSTANAGSLSLLVDLSSKLKASYGIDLFGVPMGSLQLSIIEDAWRDIGGTSQDGNDLGELVAQIIGPPVPTATPGDQDRSESPTQQPTPTSDPTATPTSTSSPTVTPSPTATPTTTPSATATATDDSSGGNPTDPTATPSPTASKTSEPTKTPYTTKTPSPTATKTPKPTKTPTKTPKPTETPKPTDEPTEEPTPTDEIPAGPVTPVF